MAQSSAIRDIHEVAREDGYTDIIVTTEQGHTAVESYFLDCDRENRWLLAEGTYGWVGSDLHTARYAAFFVFSFIIIIFAMFHCLMIDNT